MYSYKYNSILSFLFASFSRKLFQLYFFWIIYGFI